MNAQQSFEAASAKQRRGWHDYLLLALIAYALPWLAIFVYMFLTWEHQQFLAGRLGPPEFANPRAWAFMLIPAAISFVILLPFARRPVPRWIAAAGVCLLWVLVVMSGDAGMK